MMPQFDPIVDTANLLHVAESMKVHTSKYITPICRNIARDEGELVGSGTFVRLNDLPYLLTNEHVACERLFHSLSHFAGDDNLSVFEILHPFMCITSPADVAATRIDDMISQSIRKEFLPSERIAREFGPADGEILFIHGYPGQNSRFSGLASGLLVKTLPFATPEVPLPQVHSEYDPQLHFAMHYPTNIKLTNGKGKPADLPDPHGMSGSFVWDTHFVTATKQGGTWTPEQSSPCGLIFAWEPDQECLIGTRIEHVRSFLLQMLRTESAYFHWLQRGAPYGDALTDWLYAERGVSDI